MKIIKFVLLTWLFWMVISLWNFRFLLGVAFPPLIFLLPSFYLKYLDFLIVPIVVGIVGMGFAIRAVFERLTDDGAVFQSVVLINLGFLAPSLRLQKFKSVCSLPPHCLPPRWSVSAADPFLLRSQSPAGHFSPMYTQSMSKAATCFCGAIAISRSLPRRRPRTGTSTG